MVLRRQTGAPLHNDWIKQILLGGSRIKEQVSEPLVQERRGEK